MPLTLFCLLRFPFGYIPALFWGKWITINLIPKVGNLISELSTPCLQVKGTEDTPLSITAHRVLTENTFVNTTVGRITTTISEYCFFASSNSLELAVIRNTASARCKSYISESSSASLLNSTHEQTLIRAPNFVTTIVNSGEIESISSTLTISIYGTKLEAKTEYFPLTHSQTNDGCHSKISCVLLFAIIALITWYTWWCDVPHFK